MSGNGYADLLATEERRAVGKQAVMEGVPGPEPVRDDSPDVPGDLQGDDGWPQLSELDLDVCLSATLPRDRKHARPAPPPRQEP